MLPLDGGRSGRSQNASESQSSKTFCGQATCCAMNACMHRVAKDSDSWVLHKGPWEISLLNLLSLFFVLSALWLKDELTQTCH